MTHIMVSGKQAFVVIHSFIHSFIYFAINKKYNNSIQKYIKDNVQYSN